MPLTINRAPVLTLWAAVVAERLGHPPDTALTLGRAVAGSAARVKARSIGREERKSDRDADTPQLRPKHVTAPVFLLGKSIRLLPNADGELRAADGEQPADPAAVEKYLTKAFGEELAAVRTAMRKLAGRYDGQRLRSSTIRQVAERPKDRHVVPGHPPFCDFPAFHAEYRPEIKVRYAT
jgi:hypothetical protein